MESCFIKGLLIGLIFGVPVGAVGAMTFRRSFAYGFKYGIVTGAGSSTADCIYAAVGVFGLTFISDILLRYRTEISIVGGTLIICMGLNAVYKRVTYENEAAAPAVPTAFLSAFAVGITNPAAILTFLFAFSLFDISELTVYRGAGLVAGVFAGTMLWWITISLIAGRLKKNIKDTEMLNVVLGIVMIIFGISVLANVIIQ